MSNKEFKLLNKLITSLGYDINEIEDIFDYEEFCEHIMQEQKKLKKDHEERKLALRQMRDSLCQEVSQKLKLLDVIDEIEKYCNNVLSFTAVRTTERDILDIINKSKEN